MDRYMEDKDQNIIGSNKMEELEFPKRTLHFFKTNKENYTPRINELFRDGLMPFDVKVTFSKEVCLL